MIIKELKIVSNEEWLKEPQMFNMEMGATGELENCFGKLEES